MQCPTRITSQGDKHVKIADNYSPTIRSGGGNHDLPKRLHVRQSGTAAIAISALAALLTLSACDTAQDADTGDDTGLTNVDPRDAAAGPDAPEVPVVTGRDADQRPAIGADAVASVDDPERTIFAVAEIAPVDGSGVTGNVEFRENDGIVVVEGHLQGLFPGRHGLHIHETGDCSGNGAAAAGGHLAPDDDPHGAPDSHPARHHMGDLGNVTADAGGQVQFTMSDAEMTLGTGAKSVLYKALIVHAGEDDLATQPAGASGDRVGCGVIERDLSPAY